LPEIVYFEFTGGEPFLIEEHFELLKFAVDSGHSNNIEIHYNTNATVFPEHAIDIWKNFKTVEIAFSIDNVGNRFEYERYGAKWNEANRIVNYVNELRKTIPNIKTQVCLTASIFNIYYMEELCEWIDSQLFDYDYFNLLHGEKEFRIDMMTPQAKDAVIDKLRQGNFKPSHRREIDRLISFIASGPGSDGKAFIEKVKRTDKYRKQSLTDTHREIAILMGYND
jgi:glutamate-1-semialdehyde 2,1-aminomutase